MCSSGIVDLEPTLCKVYLDRLCISVTIAIELEMSMTVISMFSLICDKEWVTNLSPSGTGTVSVDRLVLCDVKSEKNEVDLEM